jgi:hypothetical protein
MGTKLNCYLSEYSSLRGQDLSKCTPEQLAKGLHHTSHFFSDMNYVLVGHADVTVTLLPRGEAINRQVVSLRKQQTKIRAEAQAAANRIEQQINSLLAIEGAATEVSA